jgi:DNA-binding IclR family transcriptional regulator
VGQDPGTSCYYLTLKLVELGARAGGSYPFVHTLSKYVKQAAAAFSESASLCVERDMLMVYIAIEEGPGRMLQTLHRIGHIAPMHATGVGKLHLINYSETQLGELEKKRGFPRYTGHTITSLEGLRKEVAAAKLNGYAMDNEECEEGVRCIAVPILNYQGQVAAAISVSAPVTRMDGERSGALIEYLKNLSHQASRELGWAG